MNTATASGGQSSPGKRTQQAFSLDPILKDEVVQLTCQSPRLAEAVDTLHVEVVNQFADCLNRQVKYPLRDAKWGRVNRVSRVPTIKELEAKETWTDPC